MANDIYQFPAGSAFEKQPTPAVYQGPLKEALHYADSVQYTPEKYPDAFKVLKDMEDEVYGFRNDALAIDSHEKRGIKAIWSISRPRLTEDELLRQESIIGGSIFGRGRRFWLGKKGTSEYAKQNNIGDWYYTSPSDPNDLRSPEIVIHYESRSNRFAKLYLGKAYDLPIAELETICKAIPRYVEAVREKLYPFDETVHELQVEVDEEKIINTNTAEEMFGKEAVDRMVREHKASLEAQVQRELQEAAYEQARLQTPTEAWTQAQAHSQVPPRQEYYSQTQIPVQPRTQPLPQNVTPIRAISRNYTTDADERRLAA